MPPGLPIPDRCPGCGRSRTGVMFSTPAGLICSHCKGKWRKARRKKKRRQ